MRSLDTSQFTSLLGGEGNGSMSSSQKGTLIMKMRDDDGSGALSSREAGMSSARFKQADANGDGNLTAEEIAKDIARPVSTPTGRVDLSSLARSLLASHDENRSGGMGVGESGLTAKSLAVADTDGDGELDASELADHLEKNLPDSTQRNSGGPVVRTYRSMALEGAMSLLGGVSATSPWYTSPQKDSASDWFG